jgi:protein-disulfide isomerase
MSKRFLLVIVICVIALIGIFVVTKPKANAPSSNAQPSSHIEGKGAKNVTLVEYGDYECPICYAYYPVLKQLETQFANDIYFQFRNLPLFQIHKNAFAGARAAEAASLQNKFWEMHDLLYENQDPNGQSGWVVSPNPLDGYFASFAQQLGLNVTKFKQDYASSQVNDTINADLGAFNKTGQQEATPTFFLDGKYVSNGNVADNSGPSLSKFSAVIKAEIALKSK